MLKSVSNRVATVPLTARKTLAKLEAEHIQRVLEYTGGNRTAAAQILGISRVGLLAKMKNYGIDIEPSGRGGGNRHSEKQTED